MIDIDEKDRKQEEQAQEQPQESQQEQPQESRQESRQEGNAGWDEAKWDAEHGSFYDKMTDYLQKRIAETEGESEKERKARERRERTIGVVNGIGEMVTALGNLYHTTKGAPNMYDPKQTFSSAYEARMEKARAARKEREGRHDRYMQQLQGVQTARSEAKRKAKADAYNEESRQQRLQQDKESREKKQAQKTAGGMENVWMRMVYEGNFDEAKVGEELEERLASGELSGVEYAAMKNALNKVSMEKAKRDANAAAAAAKANTAKKTSGGGKVYSMSTHRGKVEWSGSQMNENNVRKVYNALPAHMKQMWGKISTQQEWQKIQDFFSSDKVTEAEKDAVLEVMLGIAREGATQQTTKSGTGQQTTKSGQPKGWGGQQTTKKKGGEPKEW